MERREREGGPGDRTLAFVAESTLPTVHGIFKVRAYRDADGIEPLALLSGDVMGRSGVLVRVHDECLTSEVLGSLRCDCKEQLDAALAAIQEHGGVVVYLRQEGRGIGLANKIAAYALQEKGFDTVDANRALGLPDDARRYDAAAAILADLGIDQVRLLTNNPRKITGLEENGIHVAERIPIVAHPNAHSADYLQVKTERMGHLGAVASK